MNTVSALIRVPGSSDFDDRIGVLRRSQFSVVQSRCVYRPVAATRDIDCGTGIARMRGTVDIGVPGVTRDIGVPGLAGVCRDIGYGKGPPRMPWRGGVGLSDIGRPGVGCLWPVRIRVVRVAG